MAKLTKAQIKAHDEAVALLAKDRLNEDEREFVFANWQESATNVNSAAGAFFTPLDFAMHLALEVGPCRVIDLCAGVGILSYAILQHNARRLDGMEIVCLERNPQYVAVGRKLVPEARWIEGDVFDALDMGLGRFDVAVSNPPFGNIKRSRNAPGWTGKDFEFHVIDIASRLANFGVFILPQLSAGFNFSGRQFYERQTEGKAVEFQKKTGLFLEAGCGVDTSIFRDQWRGVAPQCEIVTVDFEQAASAAADDAQPDLFGAAA